MTLSVTALVQALRAQHDVERLIPGNVLQAQRDAARDGVADDDVLTARVGEQLQHGAGIDVLEVQRQALTRVGALFFGLRRDLAGGLHFDHVLIIGLVRELFEITGGVDDDAGAVVGALHVERRHRRGEVERVEAADQVTRHGGAREIDQDLIAELAHADRRARIGQVDDDAAHAIGTAAEVDALDRAAGRAGAGRSRSR
jgi:hypothetical protein